MCYYKLNPDGNKRWRYSECSLLVMIACPAGLAQQIALLKQLKWAMFITKSTRTSACSAVHARQTARQTQFLRNKIP